MPRCKYRPNLDFGVVDEVEQGGGGRDGGGRMGVGLRSGVGVLARNHCF